MRQLFNERSILFLGCDPNREEYMNIFRRFAVSAQVNYASFPNEFYHTTGYPSGDRNKRCNNTNKTLTHLNKRTFSVFTYPHLNTGGVGRIRDSYANPRRSPNYRSQGPIKIDV